MISKANYRVLALVIAVVSALSIGSLFWVRENASAQETVSLGVEFNTHATPVWIALHNNQFEKNGIRVDRVFKFRTGLELAAAMARGDVDIGWACLGPALMIIDKGIPVVIVAKYHNYGYGIVVDPKVIRDIGDLEGKTIYTPGKGSPAYLLLLRVAEKYNISYGSIRFMPPPEIFSALLSGRAVAAALPEHYLSLAESKGYRVLVRAQDIWPDMPGSFIVVQKRLLEENPGLVKKIVSITNSNLVLIKNNPDYVASIDAMALGIPLSVARRSIGMLEWNTTIDYAFVQEYIDYMYSHGILKHRLNATDIIRPLG